MKAIASNGVEIQTGEAVLVRNSRNGAWVYCNFSHADKSEERKYVTSYVACKYCIPYKGNEDLVGTTGDFNIPKNSSFAYTEKQEQWIKNYNIRVEDKVKITRKANSRENGWGTYWNSEMDNTVGKCGKLIAIDHEKSDNVGILILVDDEEHWYPYHILEKVEKKFKFGAKVKAYNATDVCNNNKIGILIDQDKDDPYYKYRVAFPVNDNTEGNTDWFSEIEYLD